MSDRLSFAIGDSPVLDYVLHPADPQVESPRPYFAPMRTLAGDVMTGLRPPDHVWHKGLSWSLPVVGDDNFWGGPSYVSGRGYVQLENNGTQRHDGLEHLDLGEVDGIRHATGIDQRLHWTRQDGRTLFVESRRVTVSSIDERAWVLTFSTTMTNITPEPIALGSPATRGHSKVGYGGLFWRGPSSFTGGRILVPDAPATVAARTEPSEAEPRDIRAPWLGFAGEHPNGRSSTIVMVDGEATAAAPTPWFARSVDYPGLCPAPFLDAERIVPPAGDYRARYAVVVGCGDHDAISAERLADEGRAALKALDALRALPAPAPARDPAPAHPATRDKDSA
ncbi:PmoA family protein [Agreia sp. COWG]|uniref:DUF6807 domain-containing protein n=1 Tax=Agreia sp. COWG TaxID=2773266 RepID=UPI001926BBDF|nr:PmoA family protein [Agreia sp. COWG]CAD6010709.1 Methane monooxygenase PmoA-like [Agreia sp. COWG]